MQNVTEMLKGVLEGCVLETIKHDQTYGYEITQRLREQGFVDVVEGTVYAILVRLEKNGLVRSEKKPSEVGPPRKFYDLTDAGVAELRAFWEKWDFLSQTMNDLRRSK